MHGDTCATFYAGDDSQQVRELGEGTREAMMRAIRAVKPGRPISVVGRISESYAKRFGYGVVRDCTGQGVGPGCHTGPTILHCDEPRAETLLEPGMTFTIEPMLTLGGLRLVHVGRRVDIVDQGRLVGRAVGAHGLWSPTYGAEILTSPTP